MGGGTVGLQSGINLGLVLLLLVLLLVVNDST